MMSLSRNISPRAERYGTSTRRIVSACLAWLFLAAGVRGGSSTRTVFPLVADGSADSNLVQTVNGIGLAVEREATVKLLGDSFPDFSYHSKYSDVTVAGTDTFTFTYVDTAGRRVMSQGVRLLPDGSAVMGRYTKMCDIVPTQDCYLHIDQGKSGLCASYVQKGSGAKRYLQLSTGSAYRSIDSATATGWLFPSQCAFSGDTFLVIGSTDMNRVNLRKVYARGSVITVVAEVTVATASATPDDYLMNCAVAADSDGNILTSWILGSPNSNKLLHYQIFGPDLSPGPSGSYLQPISESAAFYYYDDVGMAAFGPGRFAVVSWDANGVVLHQLRFDGSTVQDSVARIISKAGVKFCTVAATSRHMVVAAVGDVDGNGIAGIEGLIYKINNFVPGAPEPVSFSSPSTGILTADLFSSALNASIDDSGTFALTWRNQEKVGGCIWSHRAIRYPVGFYTSPVESLTTGGDSVQFHPVTVTLSSNAKWYTVDSLRTGASPADCMSAPWRSFSNQSLLAGSRTLHRYYQYRITLCRATAGIVDSFTTPGVSSVQVTWNTQPMIDGIDSVTTGAVTWKNVAFGDTVIMVSRSDSAAVALRVHDRDAGQSATVSVSQQSTPSVRAFTGGTGFTTSLSVHPRAESDTVVPCFFTVTDDDGWAGVRPAVYLKTRNSLPRLRLRLLLHDGGGSGDTLEYSTAAALAMQAEDTLEILYAVADSNDASRVRGYVDETAGGNYRRLDSVTTSGSGAFVVRGDTVVPADTLRLRISSEDPDTSIGIRLGLVVNHPPRLRAVVVNGDTLDDGDTLNVVLDAATVMTVSVDDTDCAFGDTLLFRTLFTAGSDSLRSVAATGTLRLVPSLDDSLVRIIVSDRFNRSDSLQVRLAYPVYAIDTVMNPGYAAARRLLKQGPSLIAGSSIGDTIAVPLLNSGRDRLYLTGCSFISTAPSWLTVAIRANGSALTVDPAVPLFEHPVVIEPQNGAEVSFMFDAGALAGDTVRCSELIVRTNDPRHAADTFFFCLEYNDLPRIVSVNPHFIADRPYRSIAKMAAYTFPPHASIAVSFSEPMDSASLTDGVTLYSVPDARISGRIHPIPLQSEWLQGYTVALLSPRYVTSSPAFGVRPPEGLFIPTDSLVLLLSSDLHDRAATPSGPNALDVDRDFRRDTGTDTSFGMRVDRIDFTVASIEPAPGRTDIIRRPAITLTYSSPVYAASVDTSLHFNRSLIVTTEYSGGDTVPFRSVTVDSTEVVFQIAPELFYHDSLICTYRSRWVNDRMGFATDNNGDGIDATLFDTAAREDDLQWGYRVKMISVSSVSPDSGSTGTEVSPLVTIRFDDRLVPGVIDTDTSLANRSLKIGSTRTGWSSFSRVTLTDDSMGVQVRPRAAFFSNDSVFCRFSGFTGQYRYSRPSNLPDSGGSVFSAYAWSFESGEIGFYTFPNPYKPGINPRHCSNNGPCGIWFKNLHTLGNGLDEVAITVFSQTAHPVFSSRKAGTTIRFGTGTEELPQWLWDTRNTRGEPVATGLYLYAVYDMSNKVLQKGKLVIVR